MATENVVECSPGARTDNVTSYTREVSEERLAGFDPVTDGQRQQARRRDDAVARLRARAQLPDGELARDIMIVLGLE
jgi:hypothetical protein